MAGDKVLETTDASFKEDVLDSTVPVIVDFWAVWCGPCRALSPIVDQIAEDNAGKIKVVKLNTDENPQTAANYGIRGIPTLLVFKNGQVVDQSVGVVPKAHLQGMVDRVA